jgi:integrase
MIRTHKAKDGTKSYGVRLHRGGGRYQWLGTFPTLREAKRAEAEALLKNKRTERLTVDQLVERFLSEYERTRKSSSLDKVKTALKPFQAEHGSAYVDLVSVDDAENFAKGKEWALPPVVTLFNYAKRHGVLGRSPFEGMTHKTSPGRRDLDPLTEEEVDRLATIAGKLHGRQWASFIRFAAYSGLRMGELYALEWRDIDLEEDRIRVRRRVYRGQLDLPKGNKQRLIALLPQAQDALLGLPRDNPLIFPAKRGGRLSSSSMSSHYWPPIIAVFGKPVDPHELRHFCGHYMYVVKDLPSRSVAAQLGHSSPRLVEDLYSHWRTGALDDIDRVFGKNVRRLRDASA